MWWQCGLIGVQRVGVGVGTLHSCRVEGPVGGCCPIAGSCEGCC